MCMVHLRRSPASHNPPQPPPSVCPPQPPQNGPAFSSPCPFSQARSIAALPILSSTRTPRGRKASATTKARIRPRSASRPPAHHPEPLSHGLVDLFIFSFPVPFLIFPRAIDTAHRILEIPDSHSHHEIPSHQTRTITIPAISASSFRAPKPCIYCHGEPMPRTLRRVVSVVGGQCEGFVCRAVGECTITYGEPLPQGSYCRFG